MGKDDSILDLGSWFILRTATVDTIKLVKALARFGVWTPIERRVSRTPRKRAQFEREIALTPSYAFAPVDRLDDILALSFAPASDQPKFSVFLHRGGVPLVSDNALAALRGEEDRLTSIFNRLKLRQRKGPKMAAGDEVNIADGPFVGMSGIVEGQQGRYTLVSFAGYHKPIHISSVLLLDREEIAQAA